MQPYIISVTDGSQVAEARRVAGNLAAERYWGETAAGKLALVVTEAATNLVKHAQQGEIHLRPCGMDEAGVEMLAFDRGPGMLKLAECLADGFSTQGSPGSGLGAITRLADEFDICSFEGKGTSIVARLYDSARGSRRDEGSLQFGLVQAPIRGERECGDSWGIKRDGTRTIVLLADGLGHGPDAATASRQAVSTLTQTNLLTPVAVLEEAHRALRPTRGAAVAVASIDPVEGLVRFAGVGNISAMVVTRSDVRHMVSHNGTAGHNVRHLQEFSYKWSADSLLIMHSDGITTRWRLDAYPGLWERDPSLIASVLFRDESRGRDDVCVFVGRTQ